VASEADGAEVGVEWIARVEPVVIDVAVHMIDGL
jgi:hypothetical protein